MVAPGAPTPPEVPAHRAEFSPGYARYVLGVLLVVYVFNFIDRQVLAILLEEIRLDLEVSDTLMGLLIGPAFVIFYTLAGIPIALWADRGVRRNIVALAVGVWSAATCACGLAQGFWQLALARVFVGVGEAGGTPPSHALLSDVFPPQRRATALAFYAQGIYLGVMIAYLAGGVLGEVFDWRTAFVLVGAPGLLLALLVRFTVREPTRGWWEGARGGPRHGFGEVFRVLRSRASFLWLVLAGCGAALAGYGFLNWAPAFLIRVHGMSLGEIGLWMGLIVGLGGSGGAFLGGVLADRLGERDERWYAWLSALVSLVALPFAAAFLLLDARVAALLAFIPFYAIGSMYVGPLWSMTQGLVPASMRATASAILLFLLNIVGAGLGPFVVGALNDALAGVFGEAAIRYSLLLTAGMGGLASVPFLLSARTLRADLAVARSSGRGG